MVRGVVTEAAFVSECLMDGKPAVYLQTHTGDEKRRTIRNEWFRVTDSMSGTPVFSPVEKPPEGTVESVTVEGSRPGLHCSARELSRTSMAAVGWA